MEIEYYRSLAAEIQRCVTQGKRRILITSSGPGEGKSTITAELGRTLARSGKTSVVLIDTDQYRPTLHRLFGLENTRGLGEMLKEIYQLDPKREDPRQFGVGDWLELLHMQARSGMLMISEGQGSYVVKMQRGTVVSVADPKSSEDRRLGNVLVSRGRLTTAERDNALRVHEESRRPMGDVVLRLGYVEAQELEDALHAQFTERFRHILTMRDPRCVFNEAMNGNVEKGLPAFNDSGIDEQVARQIGDYLKHPFLASRMMGYLRDTQLDNLKVLTSGTAPYDLIDHEAMAPFSRLLTHMARMFDVVLIDSPPVAVASPTEAIAGLVDGVILVVKAEGLEVQIIQRAKEQLEKRGAHLLGAVLNQVDLSHADPVLHYYYAYRR